MQWAEAALLKPVVDIRTDLVYRTFCIICEVVACEEPDQRPVEQWHRRGMLHPDEIAAIVHQRLAENIPVDPTYGDFFGARSRPAEDNRRASFR